MKEKIDQYAKGIFEYHMPEVVLGTSELSVTVDAGEIVQGSFRISNKDAACGGSCVRIAAV